MPAFACPACGQPISSEAPVGARVHCPSCQHDVIVPATAPGQATGATVEPMPTSAETIPRRSLHMGLAVASMICGIAGLFTFFVPLAALGFFLGLIAWLNANREPQRYGGLAFAAIGMCASVISVLFGVLGIGLFGLSHRYDSSYRAYCSSNLRGISQAMATYANDNDQYYPIPPFKNAGDPVAGRSAVTYVGQMGVSPRRDQPTTSGESGSDRFSTSRCFWMLVRDGCAPKLFVCPNSGDAPNQDDQVTNYWDFGTGVDSGGDTRVAYKQLSYGIQVGFGARGRPTTECSNRMPLAADKGWYGASNDGDGRMGARKTITATLTSKVDDWRPWNSPNHGGFGQGEGQNLMYADAHVEFFKRPIEGLDNDNIYTRWRSPDSKDVNNRVQGAPAPWTDYAPYSDSDTFIYP